MFLKTRQYTARYRTPFLLAMVATMLLLSGCDRQETVIRGQTMGTTYMVKVVTGRFTKTSHLKALIDERLAEINASMSTYLPDSEISRFNTETRVGKPFEPSADFLAVMRVASDIHASTQGAWDGSLDPLITLWGFGRDQRSGRVPTPAEINTLKERVDFSRIAISTDGKLVKKDPHLSIDLASIAKGYGVDQIARLLNEQEINDYLVEIGGEMFAAGHRIDGQPWRVGINRPNRKAGLNEVYKVVALMNKAFATSGDYRNYFQAGGRYYSHILDPRTGYPVTNGVVSASVLADTCVLADGLATALMVMGPQAGLKLVDGMPGVEALIIVRLKNDRYGEYASQGFQAVSQSLPDDKP